MRHLRRFAYGLTLLYAIGVLLVWLLVVYLPMDAQVAAILFAIACLLIVTGATLIAVYSLVIETRSRYDDLLRRITPKDTPDDPSS